MDPPIIYIHPAICSCTSSCTFGTWRGESDLGAKKVATTRLCGVRLPDRRRAGKDIFEKRLPHIHLSLSSNLARQIAEIEREASSVRMEHISPTITIIGVSSSSNPLIDHHEC